MKRFFMKLFRWFRRNDRTDSVSNTKLDLVPGAVFLPDLKKMKSRGSMTPKMIVVHFTAGHQDRKGSDAVKSALKNGYGYLYIDHKGIVYQQCDLDRWYYHAGKSKAPKFTTESGKSNVSRFSIGIEVASGGKLKRVGFDNNGAPIYETWFKRKVNNWREVDGDGYIHKGAYQMYTDEQEQSLLETVKFLCQKFDIPPQNVVGHDEISPSRKNDPGGALSTSMPKFRDVLRSEM